MIELSEAGALAFYTTVYPKNTIIQNMPNESIKYTGTPYIGEDGKMKFDLYDTEQP